MNNTTNDTKEDTQSDPNFPSQEISDHAHYKTLKRMMFIYIAVMGGYVVKKIDDNVFEFEKMDQTEM